MKQYNDICIGFFAALVSVMLWLVIPLAHPLLIFLGVLVVPPGLYLTFILIGLIGGKKRSSGVPTGVLAFLAVWALMGLSQELNATYFRNSLGEQSKFVDLVNLPATVLTGHSSRPWECRDSCVRALKMNLTVILRHKKGFHQLSIGSGEKCLKPKSLRATKLLQHFLPRDKCVVVDTISKAQVHAVEFKQGSNKSKKVAGFWGKRDRGKGFPSFRWRYFPWEIILHQKGTAHTIANGYTGETQSPFWLPLMYINPLPRNRVDYGRFGVVNLYVTTTPIGQGWSRYNFTKHLAMSLGGNPSKNFNRRIKQPNKDSLTQKKKDRQSILRRLNLLANSNDSDDREAAAAELGEWRKAGGEFTEIRQILKTLLQHKEDYKRSKLYYQIMVAGNTVPNWLASMITTSNPDWSHIFLGLALLKADPQYVKRDEARLAELFIKHIGTQRGKPWYNNAIAVLLPRFSSNSLVRIYSPCEKREFIEIERISEYNLKYGPFYSPEEKSRFAQHTIPCVSKTGKFQTILKSYLDPSPRSKEKVGD